MLAALVAAGGSDLHLTVGAPPTVRVDGQLRCAPGAPRLEPADTEAYARSLVNDQQWAEFARDHELDLAYDLPGVSRFRVNLYRQRGACGAALRAIPHGIRSLHELGVPETIGNFAALPRGLVLVTGPTGSGKTTTLAALIDLANRTRSGHIVTIEDPIEFLHTHQRCLVNQREVGADTTSFAVALKHALRQDPDIILVGEMRDLETVSTAITAAETGHLVFATLHTPSAAQTIDRIIDIYPPHQQHQVRTQLSVALQGVIAQGLCRRADGQGRIAVVETMLATNAIRNLIREGKTHQIPSFMQSGGGEGMLTFDQHLAARVRDQLITVEQAHGLCHSADDFGHLVGRA
ncbi:MAG: type IV pilus twitching motility protein PilT [Dactylosporangium sp.]|nr:type IV pilus twitching motility protein PilT [Dactylosporangium sp.]NNJ63182.1 type IV pilus twitching motility protein PilT [Dactylosporangium sp.]